ncbi:oligosaccharide flippase family protein [Promethearchaeum syntrophicum]|uniref:Oligosaccharide flippase family protein n=1 Tax=Promethearchaeum syntrophicum TaxID=2594042 RepID=A0A5B9DAA6_9ARCH|nr:oligosaccharide flippase family protein [Candidatus Prometheoarchaeum syntrophicum]QEE16043.1 Polysaccharide biosynthesis protein [Candidatus Prometheoarchaeum syntrophicum]
MHNHVSSSSKNNSLYKSVIVITSSKIITQLIYFLGRYVLLINWMNEESNVDFIIFFRYSEIFYAFILIAPIVIPKFLNEEKKEEFEKIISPSLSIFLINLLVIILAIVIFAFFLKSQIPQNYLIYSISLCFSTVSLGLMKYFESILYGFRKNKEIIALNIGLTLGFLLSIMIFHYFFILSLSEAIISYIIANFIAMIIGYIFLIKIKKKLKAKISYFHFKKQKQDYRDLIILASPIMLSGLAYIINFRISTLFLQDFPDEYVIFFEISSSLIIYIIGFLGIPIHDAVFPYLSYSYKEKNFKNIKEIYFSTLFIISSTLLVALIIFFSYIEFFVLIIYPEYQNDLFYNSFRILIIGGYFYVLNQFIARYPVADGNSKILFYNQIVGASVNIIFIIFSTSFNDYNFLLWGFTISNITMFIVYFIDFCKVSSISLKNSKILELSISFFSPLFIFYLLKTVNINQILSGIIVISLYFALLVLFKILRIHQIKEIFSVFLFSKNKSKEKK